MFTRAAQKQRRIAHELGHVIDGIKEPAPKLNITAPEAYSDTRLHPCTYTNRSADPAAGFTLGKSSVFCLMGLCKGIPLSDVIASSLHYTSQAFPIVRVLCRSLLKYIRVFCKIGSRGGLVDQV